MTLDLPLIVTCAGVMAALSVLHLALRPELRNGRKLSRLYAYAIGLGCYAAGVHPQVAAQRAASLTANYMLPSEIMYE